MPFINKKDYNNLEDYEKLLLIFNEENNEVLNILSEGDEIIKIYIKDSKKASEQDEVIGIYSLHLHTHNIINIISCQIIYSVFSKEK